MIKRGLAFFALLFIIVVYFVYPLSNMAMGRDMEARLSPYEDDYDDISTFKTDIEGIVELDEKGNSKGELYDIYSIVASPTILNGPDIDPKKTIYIAIGVEIKYTNEEITALLEFLRAGGHAIMADDYGYISDLARYFRVTYYRGKFFDNEFHRNENFTIVNAKLSVDQFTPYIPTELEAKFNETNTLMLNNLKKSPPRDPDGNALDLYWYDEDNPKPDGIWDSDQDNDGRIDEDPPEKGTPVDDDMDMAKSENDGLDNDHDGFLDEADSEEGLNEDQLDDDGDWIDLNNNGVQDPMIWRDKNGNGRFDFTDEEPLNGYFDVGDTFIIELEREEEKVSEYVSGDYGVDEEILDGIDNDGDTLIDEDLRGYRLLFNDATGMTSQGTRIIAHGGTSDPPSYVNLDDRPGANTPSLGEEFDPNDVVDEISSPGSEIQLIIEALICENCGGAIDIRTGKCRDTTAAFIDKPACKEHYLTKDYPDLGSIIFVSDASLFLNEIYELDQIASDDDTNEIYEINEDGEPIGRLYYNEWDNAPHDYRGASPEDKKEAQLPVESKRNYLMDQTPDGELDYDNKKFAHDLIEYLLPEGGIIVFDESRHYQENEFLVPIYASLYTVTILTSDPWYSSAMIIIFILLLSFTVIVVKNKENWIHRHNINVLHSRKSLPATKPEQVERIRWAILNKARMHRGLSPEEFQRLSTVEVDGIIKDPQLIDVVRNKDRTFTDEEFRIVMEKTTKFGK